MDVVLNVRNVSKNYRSGNRNLTVLHDISFNIATGSVVAIVGPSGSGKTTLLGLCAGLDSVSSGTIELDGILLNEQSEDERAFVRSRYTGFIFQNFQLIPTLTALENVMVPLELQGAKHIRPVALDLLEKVGLADRLHHYPAQLSGGEQQRVAIARAFSTRPKILFADEPTGNLDDETSATIVELLFELNRASGTTLILVTHNAELAERAHRIIRLKGGHIVADEFTGNAIQTI
ncbi:MAG TPA: ABC transporter ATP-binding protein [Agriterribacter sp.]|nr:ABC transporter ATP-binding protein [Agriterribacter sp.]